MWQWRKYLLEENRMVHIMTSPCVLLIDSFKLMVFQQTKYSPEGPLKIEWEEGIYHATIDLAHTCIWLTNSWIDKILDHFVCKIAACAVSKRLINMQNHPRNTKSNRIHQPEAQDSKTYYTFPVLEVATPTLSNPKGFLFRFRIFLRIYFFPRNYQFFS